MTLVIAHRGASAVEPENSLAAFRRAVALGADGIELDVHVSADGMPLVHHDPAIGGRSIAATRQSVLRRHRLANGEPVPTLAEALEPIGTGITVFVELKALDPRHDEALFRTLDEGPAPEAYHVHSFDHRIVRRLRDARPSLTVGVLSTSYPIHPARQLADAAATELWQVQDLVDGPLIRTIQQHSGRVYAWTVDEEARIRELAAMAVDGICTNRPDRARQVLR